MKQLLHTCCLLFLLSGLFTSLTAQEAREVIHTDDALRTAYLPARTTRSYRSNTPDTLDFSAANPFFDDFSADRLQPDSNLWFLGNSTFYPLRSEGMAVEPPTQGVMTFDGADISGESYETFSLIAGPADILPSHYIDLSGFGPGNNIKLSFFLQPQGLGNRPESSDSFLVRFVTNAPDTITVYSTGGKALRDFEQVVIPLDDPGYFHTQFQMIFENYGSLNGYLDQWHLDYVYLGANRSNADTVYNDIAPVNIVSSPLAPYTAIPYEHYDAGSFTQGFEVLAGNLSGNNRNSSLTTSISDPVGGTVFNGTQQQQDNANMAPRSQQLVSVGAFSDQNFTYDGVFELTASLPTTNDDRPQNNVLTEQYRIDTLFAYDDGSAEGAYGLNKAKGFGARFDITGTDSVDAVWISFVPLLNFNPSSGITTYMENKGFRLIIWFDEHPDSVSYQQVGGTNIRYGDSLNHFERYALNRPVVVRDRFWVGIQQLDALPVGVGLDLNLDNGQFMYWDSVGIWTQSNINGSLMIRPEMVGDPNRQRINPNPPTPIESDLVQDLPVKIFPNPLPDESLHILLPEQVQDVSIQLMDIRGRLKHQATLSRPGRSGILYMPKELPDGLYLLHMNLRLANGRLDSQVSKLLFQRRR